MKTSSTRRSILKTVAGAAVASALVPGVAWAEDTPLRLGFSIARTGPLAPATVSQSNTYQLWLEQINARGGMDVAGKKRKVEFVVYDDQSKPDQAVRVYEKLITDDKVDLLLAPWGTPFQIAIAPVVERYRFPVIGNTAASVNLRKVKPGYIWFPTSAIPDQMGAELTALLIENKVKTVAVIANILPFTKEIKNFLEPELAKAGIEVRFTSEYPPTIKDMTSMLTQIKQANVDGVLALSYPGDSILYARQAKEMGLTSPFQFIAVGPADASFTKAVGKTAADGVVTIAHWAPRPDWKGSQELHDDYVKRFGEEPDYLNTPLAWMSLQILEAAVARNGLDKEKIREFVSSETFDTVNGKVKFDGVQNAITPTAFVQIQHSGVKLVWPKSIATGRFVPKSGW